MALNSYIFCSSCGCVLVMDEAILVYILYSCEVYRALWESLERLTCLSQQALPTPTAVAGSNDSHNFSFSTATRIPSVRSPDPFFPDLFIWEILCASQPCLNSSISNSCLKQTQAMTQHLAFLKQGQTRNQDPWCLVIKGSILVQEQSILY